MTLFGIVRLGRGIVARCRELWPSGLIIIWVDGLRSRIGGILPLLLVRGMLVRGVLPRPILKTLTMTVPSSIRLRMTSPLATLGR